jgi:hypothetical protein
MTIKVSFPVKRFTAISKWLSRLDLEKLILIIAFIISISGIVFAFKKDIIVSYGDAESHLNIAKRVVNSLTPGMAQLGGIWLPLPHILMLPFIYFDPLWRSGLAGSIVSGTSFIISAFFIYKLTLLLTKNKPASFFAFLVFVTNPNLIYMQATPMTELTLIVFFILSSYFFVKYLLDPTNNLSLIMAATFGFCATLSRYDGWFLVGIEALIIVLTNLEKKFLPITRRGEGQLFLFSTVAFFGILSWLGWGLIILGDPLYFTRSQFSANSQQQGWLAHGQLPAYHNFLLSFLYYFITSMSNVGVLLFIVFLISLVSYLFASRQVRRFSITLLLMVPFIFYFVTLFMGQSVIFTPHITPIGYDWRLFNVRYGLMMIPAATFFVGYLFSKSGWPSRFVLIFLLLAQFGLYFIGYSKVVTYEDGVVGLSSARRPDAERWLAKNYDNGRVLMDDYSRTFSVIRGKIPMQNIIYIGTKPYWDWALAAPQSQAKWVILQKDDTIWKNLFSTPEEQGRLYKYYRKVYTSDEILIFELI